MKKIALILGAVAMIASATVPASADGYNQHHRRHHHHNGGNGGAVVGGIIGGMIIGGLIANQNRGYYQGGGYYVREEYYEPQCANRWVRIWDPYRGEWMHVKRVYCQ